MAAPKKGWPMFFGMNHQFDGSRRTFNELASVAVPGHRCFLEIKARQLADIRSGKISADGAHTFGVYVQLVHWLDGRSVEIVPLDKLAFGKTEAKVMDPEYVIPMNARRSAKTPEGFVTITVGGEKIQVPARMARVQRIKQQQNELIHYVRFVLRERSWQKRILSEAGETDFFVVHPTHLSRLQQKMQLPETRIQWIDRSRPFTLRYAQSLDDSKLTPQLRQFEERLGRVRRKLRRLKTRGRMRPRG